MKYHGGPDRQRQSLERLNYLDKIKASIVILLLILIEKQFKPERKKYHQFNHDGVDERTYTLPPVLLKLVPEKNYGFVSIIVLC